jgi:hypothetical protein
VTRRAAGGDPPSPAVRAPAPRRTADHRERRRRFSPLVPRDTPPTPTARARTNDRPPARHRGIRGTPRRAPERRGNDVVRVRRTRRCRHPPCRSPTIPEPRFHGPRTSWADCRWTSRRPPKPERPRTRVDRPCGTRETRHHPRPSPMPAARASGRSSRATSPRWDRARRRGTERHRLPLDPRRPPPCR